MTIFTVHKSIKDPSECGCQVEKVVSHFCPVCNEPIALVREKIRDPKKDTLDHIVVKYNRMVIDVSVEDTSIVSVVERKLGEVLGLQNIKIIHKGKIIYPSNDLSMLIQYSNVHKPSLLVVGDRRVKASLWKSIYKVTESVLLSALSLLVDILKTISTSVQQYLPWSQ